MGNPLLVPEFREMLAADDRAGLQTVCAAAHPGHIAEFLAALSPEEIRDVLSRIEPALAADIFHHLEDHTQVAVAEAMSRQELARLVTHMGSDDRVDLLKRMPENRQDALLSALATAEREDIRRLASYPERTAGAVMTTDYATLAPDLTAEQAIARLRREAPDKETIYYCYVVDESRRLLGFVSLKDLILAPPERRVADLMHTDVISIGASEDQETAARLISKYDLIALPVVNDQGVLVGIITHDDAMEVLAQEQTEDIEKLMAIGGGHEVGTYLRTSPWAHFKSRVLWIVVLAALGLVSGAVVQHFEATLSSLVILAFYMPMLADTGGNTGSQSATVVIRALALGEVRTADALRVLGKELQVATLLAMVLFAFTLARVFLVSQGADLPAGLTLSSVGLTIAIALALQVVTATLIGAALPLVAAALRCDPAVVASPALTTIVDITGLLLYFTLARLMLGL